MKKRWPKWGSKATTNVALHQEICNHAAFQKAATASTTSAAAGLR